MRKKFSASVSSMQPGKDTKDEMPKSTVKFDHELEDKIRVQSRKLIYLVSELKEEKIIPLAFGLLFTNEKVRKLFDIEKSTLTQAYLEYDQVKFSTIKDSVIQSLADSKIPVESQHDGLTPSGRKVIRLQIDIKALK